MSLTRGPSELHKIRKLTVGNRTGDVFGITVPNEIATGFVGVSFKVYSTKTSIILTSGARAE